MSLAADLSSLLYTPSHKNQPPLMKGREKKELHIQMSHSSYHLSTSDHTLSDLAEAIIDAYRFDHEHLYSFFMDDEKWSPYKFTSPDESEGPHADRIKIGELNLRKRQRVLFLYDYGREWQFEVELESIEKDKPKPDRPKIIEKHGRSPEQYPGWW